MDIWAASFANDVKYLASVVSAGGEIDIESPHSRLYPIFLAVQGDAIDSVQFLIRNGSKVNRAVSWRDPVTGKQFLAQTPLMFVDSLSVAHELIQAGANVNAIDGYGCSVLEYALRRPRNDIARMLLDAGSAFPQTLEWRGRRLDVADAIAARREWWMYLPEGEQRDRRMKDLDEMAALFTRQ